MSKKGVFSIRLRQAMLISKMGQSDIANRCRIIAPEARISRQDINYYLKGNRNPSVDKVSALAKALNVDVNWLTGLSTDNNINDANNIIQSTNNSINTNNSVIIRDPNLSEEEEELLRGYNALTHRQRHDIMSLIYKYEDENQK